MNTAARPGVLVRLRLRTAWNALRALRSHSNLKIVVIIVMASAIWIGLFFAFDDMFGYLNREVPAFKPTIVGVVFSVFFLSLLVLLLFSNGIIAYGSLYRATETAFLLTQPLRPRHVYLYKLGESLLFSSWAFLFLGLPLIVAFGLNEKAPWFFYPGALVFFAGFATIPAALGGIFTLLIGRFLTNAPRRIAVACALAIVGLIVVWSADLAQAFNQGLGRQGAVWLQAVLTNLRISENPLLPSYWASHGILRLAAGEFRPALTRFWLLLSTGLFLGMIGALIARRSYLATYHRVQARGRRRNVRRSTWFYRQVERALFGVEPQMRLLLVKDVKTFLRDPVQWSQVLVFFGLLGVYFLNIRSFRYDMRSAFWNNFICLMNLGATSLTLSTFTCRFIYPLLSLEGRKFWILGLLPLDRRKLLYGKFWFAFAGAFCISQTLILISDLILSVPFEGVVLHMVTVLILCAGLSGLAVGMGALYPNLKESNPSKIVSGFGGTLNLVLSLLFVMLTIGLAVVPYHGSRMAERVVGVEVLGGNILVVSLVAAGAVGILATCVPLWLGRKAFEKMEA